MGGNKMEELKHQLPGIPRLGSQVGGIEEVHRHYPVADHLVEGLVKEGNPKVNIQWHPLINVAVQLDHSNVSTGRVQPQLLFQPLQYFVQGLRVQRVWEEEEKKELLSVISKGKKVKIIFGSHT